MIEMKSDRLEWVSRCAGASGLRQTRIGQKTIELVTTQYWSQRYMTTL